MQMHHYSSQKSNFVDFQPNPRRKVADMNRELLIQMLKRENEIRLSNPVQEMYDEERILKIIPSTSIEEAIQKSLSLKSLDLNMIYSIIIGVQELDFLMILKLETQFYILNMIKVGVEI